MPYGTARTYKKRYRKPPPSGRKRRKPVAGPPAPAGYTTSSVSPVSTRKERTKVKRRKVASERRQVKQERRKAVKVREGARLPKTYANTPAMRKARREVREYRREHKDDGSSFNDILDAISPRLPSKSRERIKGLESGAQLAVPLPIGKLRALPKAVKAVGRAVGGEQKVRKVKPVKAAGEKLEKAIVKAARPSAKARAKAVPGKAAKRTKARYSKSGRALRRRQRIQGAATIGATSVPAATLAGGYLQHTAEGLADDPKKTLKATANAIPAMGTAIAGDVAAIARGDFKQVLNEQKDYYNLIGGIAAGSNQIKVGETPEGKPIYRTAKEAVQEDVGVLPALLGAVGVGAAGRIVRGRPKAKVETGRVRALPENRKRRASTARTLETAGRRAEHETARDLRGVKKPLRKAERKKVAKVGKTTITEADTVRLIGALGIPRDKAKGLRWVDEVERKLDESKYPSIVDKDTRAVLAAVRANPDVLGSPRVRQALEGFARADRDISRKRGRLEGVKGELPEDARARQVHQAELLGELLPEERPIPSLRGEPRSKSPKPERIDVTPVKGSRHAETPELDVGIRSLRNPKGRPGIVIETDYIRRFDSENPNSKHVVYRDQDGVVRGMLTMFAEDHTKALEPGVPISHSSVVVHPDFRRQGIARKLATAAYEAGYTIHRSSNDDFTLEGAALRNRLIGEAPPPRSQTKVGTRVKARKGQNMTKAVRGEARSHKNRAKRLEAQADAVRRTDPKRAEMLDWRAVQYRTRAEALERPVNILRRAGALDRQGKKIEAEALRREYFTEQRQILDEFNARMEKVRQREGLEEPIFFKERDATIEPDRAGGGEGFRGSHVPSQEKMRKGTLQKQGRIRESADDLLEGHAARRYGTNMIQAMREWTDEFAFRREGEAQPFIVNGRQFTDLQRKGLIPDDYVQFPIQEINRVFQRGRWTEAQGLINSPLHAALRQARQRKGEGKLYMAVPRAARAELDAQMKGMDATFRVFRFAGHLQSVGLLALSPAWFAWQMIATPLVVTLRHPNLLRWPGRMKEMVDLRRKADRETLEAFQAEMGSTPSDLIRNLRDDHISSSPKQLARLSKAQRFAHKTWFGGILTNLRRGGPLLAGNRRYESTWREFEGVLEMDRMIREARRPEVHRYAQAISELDNVTRAHIAALKSKPMKERAEFYLNNPIARRELDRRVDDAIGNWTALTKAEKRAASVAIFYPFLRFSLRWTAYAYPKNNPGKAAVLATAAQINAIQLELQQNEGEDLGSMYQYGQVVAGDDLNINLQRIAPGSNAIVEALGGERGPLQAAFSPTQPVVGAFLSALAGQDPFSGRPLEEKGVSAWEAFAKATVGLPVPLRGVAQKIGPDPSQYTALFNAIREKPQNPVVRSIVPDITADPERERDAERLGHYMDDAFPEDYPFIDDEARRKRDAARAGILGMFIKYRVPPPDSLIEKPSTSSSSAPSTPSNPFAPPSSSTGSSSNPFAP